MVTMELQSRPHSQYTIVSLGADSRQDMSPFRTLDVCQSNRLAELGLQIL
jgi:hypothetical protein